MRDWTADRIVALLRVGSRLSLDWADAAKGSGVDVLKTSGTPLMPLPAHVIEAARNAVDENGTAPSQGLMELRDAIAVKLRRDNGVAVDPTSEVLVTSGAQQALFLAFVGTLERGDEVLIPTPTYFVDGCVAASGAHAVYVPLDSATGYTLDSERLEAAITPRTKAILVVNPGNPGGHVVRRVEIEALADLAVKRDLLIIADESYERIIYDGHRHISAASLSQLADRTLTIHSCSKTYALAGWRVGYVAGPASVIAELRKILEWIELGCNYVSQRAAAAALRGPQEWTARIGESFERNRNRLCDDLCLVREINFSVPEGNPNLFLTFPEVACSAVDIAQYLLMDFGVRTTPGEYFHTPGYVRLEFGGDAETIAEVGRRLRKAAGGPLDRR